MSEKNSKDGVWVAIYDTMGINLDMVEEILTSPYTELDGQIMTVLTMMNHGQRFLQLKLAPREAQEFLDALVAADVMENGQLNEPELPRPIFGMN